MIRPLQPGEEAACYAVYRDAVRIGAAPEYTVEERLAWVPSDEMPDWWPGRLKSSAVWVSERQNALDGFLTFRDDGHLDLFFVRPEVKGDGTASALYDEMIAHARDAGLTRLTTFASHLARRFLERRNWQVTDTQQVERSGVMLVRFAMETTLEDEDA